MGDSSQTTTSQSQTRPWDAAMPTINGLLGGVNSLLPNTGVNAAQNTAINNLTARGQAGNPYATAVGNVATSLLNGGGATDQNPMLQSNLDAYKAGMSTYTDPNYSTVNSPEVRAALDQILSDTTNSVNSQFAAGGRSFSGMNSQTLSRGYTQAAAPLILDQANKDIATRTGALGSVYNAGNTTSSAITGNNTTANANKVQGVATSNDALNANNWGDQQVLTAEELRKSIPASNLGLLAQIGIPLAQLGTNSNGTSTTENSPSILSQIGQVGSLFSGGANSAASGMGQAAAGAGSGLMGLLGLISDRRMKEDITQVGTLFDGTPVYRFRYIGNPVWQIGLMAQDVEQATPGAVMEFDGIKRIDYKAATEKAVEVGAH